MASERRSEDRPIWTLADLHRALTQLPRHLARVLPTLVGRVIGSADRERIMLGVAGQNRCPYCQLAHAVLGKLSGLTDQEIAALVAGEDEAISSDARELVAYTRGLARDGFTPPNGARARLTAHHTEKRVAAAESVAWLMDFANRFGNTFDAALARLSGRSAPAGASWIDLAGVSAAFLMVAAVMGPAIATLAALLKVPLPPAWRRLVPPPLMAALPGGRRREP